MTDIQSKYQKLASEYAKLRAQVPVLKKAVLDEQAKEEELQESVKGKEQSIRKLEQEVDSLSFRNQQLTARVELLQREAETNNTLAKAKKNKRAAPPPPVENSHASSVLSEELHNKITENASLHTKIAESELRHSAVLDDLRRQISQLELRASEHQSELDASQKENTALIEKLQEVKLNLEVNLQRRDKECREATDKAHTLEERLGEVEQRLSTQLASANRVIQQRLQFNDAELERLSGLNVPSYDRATQARCKELVSHAATLVRDLTAALTDFYTYSQQRARLYPVDETQEALSPALKQLCSHLHGNARVIRPVEQAFTAFSEGMSEQDCTTLDTARGLGTFASALNTLASYVAKVTPYQLLSLQEESEVPTCTAQMQTCNQNMAAAYTQWQHALSRLSTHVSLLAHQSSPSCDHPRSSHTHMLTLTAQAVTHAHHILQAVSRCYQMKLTSEHELPTVSDKVKVTNECALAALISLVNVFNKLSAFFSNNLAVLCKSTESSGPVRAHPATSVLRQRAGAYITSLQRAVPGSVPHDTALHNRKTLYSSTESRDSLTQQVVSLQERVTKLEQEKEHWMLETKLLQRKLEKETQRCSAAEQSAKMLQAEITGRALNAALTPPPSDSLAQPPSYSLTPPPDYAASPPQGISRQSTEGDQSLTTMLGQLTRCVSEDGTDSREQFIKNHYSAKLAAATTSTQTADSKALHFQAECRALSKQLRGSLRERDRLSAELQAARETVVTLKDELQTTSRSYEEQLKTMTEHLTGMNDKLTAQTDEIGALKQKLNTGAKGFKKPSFLGKQGK